jgi:hypothetical protein
VNPGTLSVILEPVAFLVERGASAFVNPGTSSASASDDVLAKRTTTFVANTSPCFAMSAARRSSAR